MWAFIYPGQGSQAPGMGKFLFDNFKIAKEVFEEASDSISVNLKQLCFDGPESDLALTENTQPALLTTSYASYKVLNELTHLKPQFALGHSIGEYAAVCSAASMPFSSAVKAVRARGQAMQAAVPVGEGAMAAVMGLDENQILALCKLTQTATGQVLEPANFNSPGQIVISGSAKAIEWLKTNFKPETLPGEPKRAKLIPLNVSAPFHCSLMKPAEEKMRKVLNDIQFSNAAFPIVQNFSALAVSEGTIIRENLIRQVSAPVRWIECTQLTAKAGVTKIVELGHGKVASGLVKKIDPNMTCFNFNSLEDIKLIEAQLSPSAGSTKG